MSKIFDLGELDVAQASEKGAEIELLHPVSNEGLGQFISVLGRESQLFRDYVEERNNDMKRKAAVAARRGRQPEITTHSEDEARAVAFIAKCTLGFRCDPVIEKGAFGQADKVVKEGGAFLRYRGENLAFSEANARKFFSDPGMVDFRKQIDKAIVDIENFMSS